MKRSSMLWTLPALALVMALFFVAGCGGDSPSSVVDDYIAALNDHDFDRIYDLASSDYQSTSPRDEFTGGMEAVWVEGSRLEDYEIVEEKVDGDTATVTFKAKVVLPGAPDDSLELSESSVELVKEGGQWKIRF